MTLFCLTTHEVYNNHTLNEDDDTFSRALYQILPKLQKYRSFLLANAKLITMNQIITPSDELSFRVSPSRLFAQKATNIMY